MWLLEHAGRLFPWQGLLAVRSVGLLLLCCLTSSDVISTYTGPRLGPFNIAASLLSEWGS